MASSKTTTKKYVSPPSFPDLDLDPLPDIVFDYEYFSVTYSAKLTQNNSVGNEWGVGLKYNGEIFEGDFVIQQQKNNELELTAFAIEYDSLNDYGSQHINFGLLSVGETKTKQVVVIVRENNGRYTGNVAKWTFTITVKRTF